MNMDEHFQIQPIKFLQEYEAKLKNMNSGICKVSFYVQYKPCGHV
jgi:hypothetical protein